MNAGFLPISNNKKPGDTAGFFIELKSQKYPFVNLPSIYLAQSLSQTKPSGCQNNNE